MDLLRRTPITSRSALRLIPFLRYCAAEFDEKGNMGELPVTHELLLKAAHELIAHGKFNITSKMALSAHAEIRFLFPRQMLSLLEAYIQIRLQVEQRKPQLRAAETAPVAVIEKLNPEIGDSLLSSPSSPEPDAVQVAIYLHRQALKQARNRRMNQLGQDQL